MRLSKSRTRIARLSAILLITMSPLIGSAKEGRYLVPKIEGGQPDLQGVWLMSNATPLERPAGIDTFIITAAQAAQIEAQINSRFLDPGTPGEPLDFFDGMRVEPIRRQLRSSIVVDPENGKLPATEYFVEAMKRQRFIMLNVFDGPEIRPTGERCLNSSVHPPMRTLPGGSYFRFVQADDRIVIQAEYGNEARTIRMHAEHTPPSITSWNGDSIGWWDGNMLVVETKYFIEGSHLRGSPQYTFLISPQATVTERITRVAADELLYDFTVDDPLYYTRPWRGETRLVRSDQKMFEVSCHEGNYALTNILRAARVLEEKE